MKRLATVVIVGASCLFLLLIIAIGSVALFGTASVSSTSTLKSGRTVTVQVQGWGGLNAHDSKDTATYHLAGHVVVVAPTQLIVDGRALATIDESVKSVAIHAHNGEITFEADGKPAAVFQR